MVRVPFLFINLRGFSVDRPLLTSLTSVMTDCSGKKAAAIPEDVWELGIMSEVSQINFSKNQLQSWPIRYK